MYYMMPADRRQYWLTLLGIEGEVSSQFTEDIDDVVWYDDDE